jgi:CBS domain-containing protein
MNPRTDAAAWETRIAGCATFDELRQVREDAEPGLIRLLEQSDFIAWNGAVNRLHDLVTDRVVRMAERAMGREYGEPPCPYAFLLLGSGGRRERTLWSDQDSALVYLDEEDRETNRSWFAAFGGLIEAGLLKAGYPPCEGRVSAGNPAWCASTAAWRRRLEGWFRELAFENVRHLLMIADVRAVSGAPELADGILSTHAALVRENGEALAAMLSNTLRRKPAFGPLGNLLTEPYGEDAGSFDVKYGAYIPMVNAVRWLAIRHGLPAGGTLERLERLERTAGTIGADEAARWRQAFLTVMRLRAKAPAAVTAEGQRVSTGRLPAALLTKETRRALKEAIRTGGDMQKRIRREARDAERRTMNGAG